MGFLRPEGHILTMTTNALPKIGLKNGWNALLDAFPRLLVEESLRGPGDL